MSPSSGLPPAGRLLVVMRHGKAEPFAAEDHRRELTPRGRRDAAQAGAWLAENDLVPTHAYISSAARALGTWASVTRTVRAEVEVSIEDSLYNAGPEHVLDVLRGAPAHAEVVMYVGHNPAAATLAHLLDSGDPEPDAFRQMSEGYPTSALAVLAVAVPWSDLDEATARLVAFHVGHG